MKGPMPSLNGDAPAVVTPHALTMSALTMSTLTVTMAPR
jgi:hypothetical protein